eukprot:9859736-Alexandrium_andersonii.AAC.1
MQATHAARRVGSVVQGAAATRSTSAWAAFPRACWGCGMEGSGSCLVARAGAVEVLGAAHRALAGRRCPSGRRCCRRR